MTETDSGLVFLFIVAMMALSCFGLAWSLCAIWQAWKGRIEYQWRGRNPSDEDLLEISRWADREMRRLHRGNPGD